MSTDVPVEEAVDPSLNVEIPLEVRELGGATMRQLVSNHSSFTTLVGTMIASRQLYAVAMRDLEYRMAKLTDKQKADLVEVGRKWLLEEKASKGEGLEEDDTKALLTKEIEAVEAADADAAWQLVEEFIIGASAHAAAQPFTEEILFSGIKQSVVPWLEEVTKQHNIWAREDTARAMEEGEKARRERNIPLGLYWDNEFGKDLPRDRSLVLYGWAPALYWLADNVAKQVLEAKTGQLFTIIRLMANIQKHEVESRLLRVAAKFWTDCCQTGSSWPKFFENNLMMHLGDPPDLLIVDNLERAAMTTALVGSTAARKGGNAHKQFRRWCDKTGCAFLGLMPQQFKAVDFPASVDWEQLRTYTTLRSVGVEEQGDDYVLTVGADLYKVSVPKDVLDNYGQETRIIVPT